MAKERVRPRFPRARSRFVRFFARPAAYEFIAAWFALFGGSANSIRAFSAGEHLPGYLWAIAASGGFVFTAGKLIAARLAVESDGTTDGLVGALMTLRATMLGLYKGNDDPKLRITLHQPIGNGQLEQVLDYVGDGRGGGTVGRRFDCRAGVIGAAYRSKEPRVGDRVNSDYDKYVQELVTDWAYERAEAQKLNRETMSWYAIPLIDGDAGRVMAVLYMDSVIPKFFGKRQQINGLLAASAIAEFAARRYK